MISFIKAIRKTSLTLVLSSCFFVALLVPGPSSWAQDNKSGGDFPLWTYDLGFAAGSAQGSSFFELNGGLNTFFSPYFSLRNAAFFRKASTFNAAGLDSSLRAHLGGELAEGFWGQWTSGLGYRLASQDLSAPFVESSVQFQLGGFQAGVGFKYLVYDFDGSDPARDNQLLLSILLGGGGRL